ncbi:MAG: TIGR04086 family membrane protein [Clostridia bacterium]|nr:TIGR04086 family membrane protein [Clostridia bacterium]
MNINKIIRSEIFGIISGICLTLIFTAFSAAVMVKMQKVMYSAIAPFAIASICIGAFVGGYVTARINKNMGMAVGAICGLAVFLIFLGTGAVFGSELGIVSLIRCIASVISGALGGILGVNKRKRRK